MKPLHNYNYTSLSLLEVMNENIDKAIKDKDALFLNQCFQQSITLCPPALLLNHLINLQNQAEQINSSITEENYIEVISKLSQKFKLNSEHDEFILNKLKFYKEVIIHFIENNPFQEPFMFYFYYDTTITQLNAFKNLDFSQKNKEGKNILEYILNYVEKSEYPLIFKKSLREKLIPRIIKNEKFPLENLIAFNEQIKLNASDYSKNFLNGVHSLTELRIQKNNIHTECLLLTEEKPYLKQTTKIL